MILGDSVAIDTKELAPWTNLPIGTPILTGCSGTVAEGLNVLKLSADGKHVYMGGRIRITGFSRSSPNPGLYYQTDLRPKSDIRAYVGMRCDGNSPRPEAVWADISTSGQLWFRTSESIGNATTNPTIFMVFASIIPLE